MMQRLALVALAVTLSVQGPSVDRREEQTLHFYNIPLTGIIDEGYSASIDIGNPPQQFNILIDTGSSNLAVAGRRYMAESFFDTSQSESFAWLHERVSVRYTRGYWEGGLALDDLKFSALPTRPIRAKFAVIDYSRHFFVNGSQWQGILGLGYPSIAEDGVKPFWETYTDRHNFLDIFSIGLCGLQSKSNVHGTNESQGVLTLGGTDKSKMSSEMQFTPIVRETYFEVVVTDLMVAGESLGMDCKEYNFPRAIVDSGTTQLRLPSRVFLQVVERIKAAVAHSMDVHDGFWVGAEVICWSVEDPKFGLFPNLSLSLLHGPHSFFSLLVVPEQYLGPVVFTNPDLQPDSNCYRFSIGVSHSAAMEGTILGATIMEGFYVSFDRAHSRIGFAQLGCSKFAHLSQRPLVSEWRNSPTDLSTCQFMLYQPNERPVLVAAYVLVSVACLCLLPLFVIFLHGQLTCCSRTDEDTGALLK